MAETRADHGAIVRDRERPATLEAWSRFKDEVKERYPIDRAIEDFSGARLTARFGQGDRMGHCPFHDDANPSMSVRPGKGRFRCHASGCGASGDVFDFISLLRNVGFMEAVLMAAEKVGLEPPSSYRSRAARSPRSPRVESRPEGRIDPFELRECDLIPACTGIRAPRAGRPFPVWHPGGGRASGPGVKWYRPEMIHVYRDIKRRPIMAVLRCNRGGDGGKYFIPIRVGRIPDGAPDFVVDNGDRGAGWIVGGPGPGRRKPIYGMEDAGKWIADGGSRILIVEGEKTRDAARRLIDQRSDADDWLVLSPMGGHGACLYADWSAFMWETRHRGLTGATFAVWPDADPAATRADGSRFDAQEQFARDVSRAFATAMRAAAMDPERTRFMRAIPEAGLKRGWDLADAEAEGWNGDRVVAELDGKGVAIAVPKPIMLSTVEQERDRAANSSGKSPAVRNSPSQSATKDCGPGIHQCVQPAPIDGRDEISRGGPASSNGGGDSIRHGDGRSSARLSTAAKYRGCETRETLRHSVSGIPSRNVAAAGGQLNRDARITSEPEVPDDGPSAF